MTATTAPAPRGYLDLSARTKLRLTGADRVRFLNGQITNDLRNLAADNVLEACVLDPKGKMNAHIFISPDGGSFYLDAAPELRESLGARLNRYIIADDVSVEDVTEQFALFHVLGPAPDLPNDWRKLRATRFLEQGVDLWIEKARAGEMQNELSILFSEIDPAAAEIFRIEMGIPRWGFELTNEIIPVEANLETRAISYEKGCYVGQETISRMKMSGQMNKRLCGFVSLSDTTLAAGMKIFSPGENKEIGWITSAARSMRLQKQIALGYAKRGYNARGTKLEARAVADKIENGAIEVVDLPFT